MTTGTATLDQSYIEDFQLLRFVQKTCLRMLELNATKGHGVWIAFCLVVLRAHSDLETRFRQLWLDEKEIPRPQRLQETSDILQTAVNRVHSSGDIDSEASAVEAQQDPTDDISISEQAESSAKVGRRILFHLRREARDMLETEDYECLEVWEHLLCLGLCLVWETDEFREICGCSALPPAEKLRVGLDIIRDVIFRRKPKHYPWVLSEDTECAS
jgi:hypothetical protein